MVKLRLVIAVAITALLVSGVWYALLPELVPPRTIEKPVEKIVEKPAQNRLETATMIFDWVPGGKYVPFYTALGKGFYQEAGLAVNLIKGQGSLFATTMVDQAKVDFGLSTILATVQAMAKGAKIKIVMQYEDKTGEGLVSFKELGVKTPKDLEGKSIGGAFLGTNALPAIMPLYKADYGKVNLISVDPAVQRQGFLQGRYELSFLFYDSDYPIVKAEAAKIGKEVVFHSFPDWGYNVYGYAILASEKTIREKPDLVKKFVGATLKGMKYSIDNPEEGVSYALRYEPGLDHESTKQQWLNTIELIRTQAMLGSGLGVAANDKAKDTLNFIMKVAKIDAKINIDDLWTNEFIPKG